MAKLNTIGERILEIRKRRGLTAADLARAAGVTRSTICYWEADRGRPSAENLYRVAKILTVPVAALTGAASLPEEEPAEFGPRLRAARMAAGLSQTALAKKIGYALTNVSHWELGRETPSSAALCALAEALGREAGTKAAPLPAKDVPEPVVKADPEAALLCAAAADAAIEAAEVAAEARSLPAAAAPPVLHEPRVMTPDELRHQRRSRAKELRWRARGHTYDAARFPSDSDDAATARAKAVNALALADLVEAHWPRMYPNLEIPGGL